MNTEPAVVVKELSKSFKLPHERHNGLKSLLINFYKHKKGYEHQHVLRDINSEIKRGEFFGIVGRNGSGKSTLLKLLAGIYAPDHGLVQVNVSLTPFIELGVGFNPELTGRENIFLNGALLGFNRKDIAGMYHDIVSFAELSRFMDQKLKNYSSGMQVRLAFSIAIRARSDILLIDEVLAVGDTAFQQKCFDYFDRLKEEGRTIIFVSHDMEAVKRYCDRCVLVDSGELKKVGKPSEIAEMYRRLNDTSIAKDAKEQNAKDADTRQFEIDILDEANKPTALFKYGETMRVKVAWDAEKFPRAINAGIAVFKGSEFVFGANTLNEDSAVKEATATLNVSLNLGPGKYKIVAGLVGKRKDQTYAFEA